MTFEHFLRFFLLADTGRPVPQNGQLPTDTHASLPVVAGDHLRLLVPQHDLGGRTAESLELRLLQNGVLSEPVGILRQQDGALCSEIKLRVNEPPADGAYKQFALVVDQPNPEYTPVNLAAGRAVIASSAYPFTPPAQLTDNDDATFWSSDNGLTVQHLESVEIELAGRANVQQIRFKPRDSGYCYPIDFLIEISDGGLTYQTALSVQNANPTTPDWVDYAIKNSVATHVRITGTRLRKGTGDDDYYRMQLAGVQVIGSPLAQPPTLEVPIVGTFRGNDAPLSRADYVQQIADWLHSYAYTPVTVDVSGNLLTVRIYHSDAFRIGHQPVRSGLGGVVELNTNTPTLTTQLVGRLTIAAYDRYSVSVSDDIEAGNVFVLAGNSYTADGSEAPADILRELGVPDGNLMTRAPEGPQPGVRLGSYVLANSNRPAIQLVYVDTAGSSDNYRAVVDPSVQAGNLYQVTADGMTTLSYAATDADTASTVAAVFNGSGAKFAVPVGKVPTGTASAGAQTIANTNRPEIRLGGRQAIAARVVDRYRAYVGSSIQPGNTYTLGSRHYVADRPDTVLDVCRGLGYSTHPFSVDTEPGAPLTAYAEPGPRYNAAEHLADVEVVAGSYWRPDAPYVLELPWPALASLSPVQLVLCDKNRQRIAASNYLIPQRDGRQTSVVAFGDTCPCFGYDYAEPGLIQRLRLPVALATGKLRQQESLGQGLDGQAIRGLTRADRSRTLTSRMLPEAFHRSLYRALKHRFLWVDGTAYRCEGEVATSDAQGRRQLMQSSGTLIETTYRATNQDDLWHLYDTSESMGYALIESIELPPALPLYLQTDSFVRQQRAGDLVRPGFYRLLIRAGSEPLDVAVYVNDELVLQSTLAAGRLNRIDDFLNVPAAGRLRIETTLATTTVSVTGWLSHRNQSAYSDDYGPDFAP